MSFHYAIRNDKVGNLLITSYGNLKSAEKYGGADADIQDTLYYAEFKDGFKTLNLNEEGKGSIVRSVMKNTSPPEATGGRYVLWGKTQGTWSETAFAVSSYGAANTLMKSLIPAYEALMVVDVGPEAEGPMSAREARKPDLSSL